MTLITKARTKSSKKQVVQTSKVKFLRLPIDEMTVDFSSSIQLENPYFSQLDALRFALGKLIKNQKSNHSPGQKSDDLINLSPSYN